MVFVVAAQESNDGTLLCQLKAAAQEYENFLAGGKFLHICNIIISIETIFTIRIQQINISSNNNL